MPWIILMSSLSRNPNRYTLIKCYIDVIKRSVIVNGRRTRFPWIKWLKPRIPASSFDCTRQLTRIFHGLPVYLTNKYINWDTGITACEALTDLLCLICGNLTRHDIGIEIVA